ncbi:heat shock protein 68-like [Leptidea sinapis]|uniref:heat shock protein 68-like n=1 Tax=Leptidea sinapis TaxID=189913 RepID=UPI00213053B7|nr:heat shock protein 68-like [Leptidea sinapis]
MVIVGIDLGTTYSCVAVWTNNSAEVIVNEQGNRTTPSYVAFTPRERLIGEAAKNQAAVNPSNTIFAVKRLIGRRFDDVGLHMDLMHLPIKVINDNGKPKILVEYRGVKRKFSPEEICSMLLYRMKEVAENYLGDKVDKAVVTVPAYFTDAQRHATILAGKIAGLDVVKILNEPTASALAYGYDKKLKGNVLIYDLGGGTFDVSILSIVNSVYKVKATAGNSRLGGEDFDHRLVTYFAEDFCKMFGVEIIRNARCVRRLKSAAEKVKHILTSSQEATVHIEGLYDGIDYTGCVTRVFFEELCSDLFSDTLKPIERVLRDAHMQKCNIGKIILVGGSTRIPKIRSMVKEYFDGRDITTSINPEEAIAQGAAIQAVIMTQKCKNMIQDVSLVDVVPLTLGVETARGMMFDVVERNTSIPCRKTKEITTLEDYQTAMTIEVFEGERALTRDNNLLGVFELGNIPPVPRGVAKIDLIFEIDANGILTVSARDKSTGNMKSITIENTHRYNKNEVCKMIADAEKFHEEDEENKLRLEVRNQLETYIYSVKQTVVENLESVSGDECAAMIGECKDALSWLNENMDCLREEYERKMSELLRRWSATVRRLSKKFKHQSKKQRGENERKC